MITTAPARSRPRPPVLAQPAQPGPAAAPPPLRQRRPLRLVYAGALLLVLGGLFGGWMFSQNRQTQPVVSVRAPLTAGAPITAEQLGTTQVPNSTDLNTIPADTLTSLLGKYPTVNLPAGTILTPGQVQDSPTPPTGQSIVGIGVKAGQLPARPLAGGDRVRVVVTSAAGASPVGAQPPGTSWAGVVVGTGPVSSAGITTVDVQLDAGVATAVSAAAGAGNVAITLETPQG